MLVSVGQSRSVLVSTGRCWSVSSANQVGAGRFWSVLVGAVGCWSGRSWSVLVGAGLVVQVRSVLVGAAQCWSGRVLLVVLLVRSVLVEVARCWYVCWSVILNSVAGLCWL